jgi:hypothetical protein
MPLSSSIQARRNKDHAIEKEIRESIVVAISNSSEPTQVVERHTRSRSSFEDFRIIIPENTLIVDPRDYASRIRSEDAVRKAREALAVTLLSLTVSEI